MVKITKKTDYGLTLLAALARKPDKHQSLRHISDEYKLPYKFIGQVAATLLDAGVVVSKEGATGGYKLSKSPAEINLRDVMAALDGPIVKVDCLRGKPCPRQNTCGHHGILASLANTLNESLKTKTLADLVK